ncbi:MAG: metallophosphoesterase [Promethearchaeota archaeon]|jgi:serine/threonine-protein phosphatase PP1 catalytic subunit
MDHVVLKNLINKPHLISNLGLGEISNILKEAKNIFEMENLLLEFNLKSPVKEIYVIGDIHGNLETLLELNRIIEENHPEIVIFLGDIVDRGPKQLECLLFVLILKILNSNKYFMLRGNHETLEMNQYYGFFQYFMNRFRDQEKFNEILELYTVLPICTLVNGTILCVHGGIPRDTEILKKLKGVKTKEIGSIFNSISHSVIQIMWNDPKENLEGYSESFRGPGINFFGEDVFDSFINVNNLKYIIRAHECFPEGYRWFFHKRLLSIFSSVNYRGNYSPNPASYAIIKNKEIIPKLLEL